MAKPDRLAKELVAASMELHRRRSWKRVPADALFLIRTPVEEEPLCAVLIGQGGEELGLALTRGHDALGQMRRAFVEEGLGSPQVEECEYLSVSFDRLSAIPQELRWPLRAAGFQTRREGIAPFLFVKPPHRHPRAPKKQEMQILLWCLRAVFAAEDQGELRPDEYRPGSKVLELEVSGTLRAPEVRVRVVPGLTDEFGATAAPVLLPADLRGLPRTGDLWHADLPAMPARIEGDERTWRCILLAAESSRKILTAEIVPSGEMAPVAEVLGGALRKHGLPHEIAFGSELLLDALAPGLAAIGVATRLETGPTFMTDLVEDLADGMAGPTWEARAPETLEDWKEAEQAFIQGFVDDVMDRDLLTPRAKKRYFGSEEVAQEAMSALQNLNSIPAFVEWLVTDYRPTKRSRTHLEKLAERKDLDPWERALLEARLAAVLSIFRVESIEVGASLEVQDVLSGRRYTIEDRALSSCEVEGCFLPMRLLRVGEWWFQIPAGPPLAPMQIDRALDFLEEAGLPLGSPDELRDHAHLLGRLWGFVLESRANPPELQNTDGDPLERHEALFRVADPAAVAAALDAREDVEAEEPGASWNWLREGGPVPGFGETTILGGLELLGDELLLEVNSARRLARAREWIETLPGVRFERATRSEPGQRPLDDSLLGPPPGPLPPEVRAELAQIIEERHVAWLDEPVPALSGLTPRAACATPEGRRAVVRMIRTLPPALIPGGTIPAPQERLLRELGLDG